jgi:hypothetical protein
MGARETRVKSKSKGASFRNRVHVEDRARAPFKLAVDDHSDFPAEFLGEEDSIGASLPCDVNREVQVAFISPHTKVAWQRVDHSCRHRQLG